MATDFNVLRSQQMPDAQGYLERRAVNAQNIRANNTAEQFNQLKMQAHKLDILKQLAGSIKDDAGLARAKNFARSMGIGDDVLGQLGDSYEQAKPLLDSFYANSDAAKTELANQWKMLEFGMKQQEFQEKTNPQPKAITFPGQQQGGLNPQQESEYQQLSAQLQQNPPIITSKNPDGKTADDYMSWRNNQNLIARDVASATQAQPKLFKVGKDIVKLDENGNPVPFNPKQGSVPADIQVANMLSDPNVPEATKENLRFAIRQTADQAGEIEREKQIGKGQGTAKVDFKIVKSNFPQLIKQTQRIGELAKTATYTKIGQAAASALRQSGQPVPKGMEDAAAYQAAVRLAILPTLRSTFGPQFTENEGKNLLQTLGDVNLSPPEKDAIIQQFILSKVDELQSKANEAGEDFNAEEYYKQVLGDLGSKQTASPVITTKKNSPQDYFKSKYGLD